MLSEIVSIPPFYWALISVLVFAVGASYRLWSWLSAFHMSHKSSEMVLSSISMSSEDLKAMTAYLFMINTFIPTLAIHHIWTRLCHEVDRSLTRPRLDNEGLEFLENFKLGIKEQVHRVVTILAAQSYHDVQSTAAAHALGGLHQYRLDDCEFDAYRRAKHVLETPSFSKGPPR